MKKYTLLAILMCFSLITKAQTSSGKHHIKYLDINSGNPDVGVSFLSDNQIVFATPPTNKIINTDKYNPQMELYKGEIDENGAIINKKAIKTSKRSKTSKSGATFSKDGKTVYFSQNKYAKRKSKRVRHELFKATVDEDGNWSNIEKVSFNKNHFSYRFPSVNKDNTRLYFVSDAKPSFGGNDIFYVDIKEDGSFGEPVNAGSTINTKGNETTPFIADNNFLYFSSDGREDGLGNMDVYASEVFENTISDPIHLTSPVNSLNDDYGYVVNADNKGFFSSNRLQGRANDDIYSFYIEPDKPKECLQEIVGTVRDKETEELISNATINVVDEEGKVVETYKSDLTGNYKFTLSCRNTYTVVADKQNYAKEEHIVNTANYYSAPPLEINQLMVKELKQIAPEKVVINVNPIYFRFDKYNISSQAATELDKIVRIMKENPELIVESASHTDARGPKYYNQKLSERRAKATVNYIVSKGIDRSRITAKGYGETQLINNCKDGKRCTIDQHRLNRRTEFVIMNKEASSFIPKENNAPILDNKKSKTAVATNAKKVETKSTNVAKVKAKTEIDDSLTAGIVFAEDEKKKVKTNTNDDGASGEVIKVDDVQATDNQPKANFQKQDTEGLNSDNVEETENIVEQSKESKIDSEISTEAGNNNLQNKINESTSENVEDSTVKKSNATINNNENNTVSNSKETTQYNYRKKINKIGDSINPEHLIKEIAPDVKKHQKKLLVQEQVKEPLNPLKEINSITNSSKQIKENPTLNQSEFSSLKEPIENVNEKNLVLENQAIAYNQFNRDFTKGEDNMNAVSKVLFDDEDDFDSYTGSETNSKRLVSKVSTKKAPTLSISEKAAEIREQFVESTKDMDKKEILSVNGIDISPMSIRKNGKYVTTSSANNVDVMRINFQIKDNEYITSGYKDVYILIQNPEGKILNRKGEFTMNNGQKLKYTEKTNAYYNNNYLNLSLMTDRFMQKITKGNYTVTIYIEGYPVGLEMFTLS